MFAGVSFDPNCLENILSTRSVDLSPDNVARLILDRGAIKAHCTVSYHLVTAAEDGTIVPETFLLLYEVLFLFCM